MKKLLSILLCLPLINLAQQTYITNNNAEQHRQTYKDSFSKNIKSFWVKESVDDSRFNIVPDPLNNDNLVLKIDHYSDDYFANGYRSELRINTNVGEGYKTEYSFRFLLTDSFFLNIHNDP